MIFSKYVYSWASGPVMAFLFVVLTTLVISEICAGQTLADTLRKNSTFEDMNLLLRSEVGKREASKYAFLKLAGPYWVPTKSQARHIRGKLAEYMLSLRGSERPLIALANYKIQYIGYSQGDKRRVFLNGFCSSFWQRGNWKENELVVVFDGGACFFQAKFNLEKDEFLAVDFNGEG